MIASPISWCNPVLTVHTTRNIWCSYDVLFEQLGVKFFMTGHITVISVLDLAVVSLQKIKLAAFEEHFEAKVCYVLFVVYVN